MGQLRQNDLAVLERYLSNGPQAQSKQLTFSTQHDLSGT